MMRTTGVFARLPDDVTIHCWTDSKVTMAKIKSDPHTWNPCVGNIIAYI